MKQQTKIRRSLIPAKINFIKKTTIRLPILTLQDDPKLPKNIKNQYPIANNKNKEKRSISQLLNIVECPQPTENVFLRRGGQKKKTLFDYRDRTNKSQHIIRRKKKPEELLKSLKTQVEEALHKLVQVKKETPKIRSLRAYIERRNGLKEKSERRYKTLEGEELTANQVTIEPIPCRKPFSYSSLESSLLKKDYTNRRTQQERKNKKSLRRGNKSQQRPVEEKKDYISGWKQFSVRYKSWEDENSQAFIPLECEYFKS